MSTKNSLIFCKDEASGIEAHLYEDCLEPENSPVFLKLSGLSTVSVEVNGQSTSVTVAVPRDLAEKLGLLVSAR